MSNSGHQPTPRPAALALDPTLVAALEPSKLHAAAQELLSTLDARTRRIMERRFGLTGSPPKTLREIGGLEKITRERVRQLARAAVRCLQGAAPRPTSPQASAVLEALSDLLKALGHVARAETLVYSLGLARSQDQAVLRFLLTALPGVTEARETQRTYRHWTLLSGTQPGLEPPPLEHVLEVAEGVLVAARQVLPEAPFLAGVKKELKIPVTDTALKSLLLTAKRIATTTFGDWGLSAWSEVTPRGVGDKSYIAIKRAEKPLHFRAVADAINAAGFDAKRAHPQTVHNELIRDSRFVLVGRGLYGLKEWGYEPGTVAEVAARILARAGRPLPKRDLIAEVLKERLVKRSTVVLAFHNKRLFKALGDGTYALAVPPVGDGTAKEGPPGTLTPPPL